MILYIPKLLTDTFFTILELRDHDVPIYRRDSQRKATNVKTLIIPEIYGPG